MLVAGGMFGDEPPVAARAEAWSGGRSLILLWPLIWCGALPFPRCLTVAVHAFLPSALRTPSSVGASHPSPCRSSARSSSRGKNRRGSGESKVLRARKGQEWVYEEKFHMLDPPSAPRLAPEAGCHTLSDGSDRPSRHSPHTHKTHLASVPPRTSASPRTSRMVFTGRRLPPRQLHAHSWSTFKAARRPSSVMPARTVSSNSTLDVRQPPLDIQAVAVIKLMQNHLPLQPWPPRPQRTLAKEPPYALQVQKLHEAP